MDRIAAVNEFLELLRELLTIARGIRECPPGDEARFGFREWKSRFEAGFPAWLSTVERLIPQAVRTRVASARPPIGRHSCALQALAVLARQIRDKLAALDNCDPLAPRNCPPSLRKLTPAAWLELAANRLEKPVKQWLDDNEGELRTEMVLLKETAGQQPIGEQPGAPRDKGGAGQGEAIGADGDQAGNGQGEGTGTGRKENKKAERGRPVDTDPKADKRIFDAWKTGQFKTYAALAREMKKRERDVELAIDRHRKRLNRERQKRRKNSPDNPCQEN
jgi:hypothetical protein